MCFWPHAHLCGFVWFNFLPHWKLQPSSILASFQYIKPFRDPEPSQMLYSLPGMPFSHPLLVSALMKVNFYSVSRLNHKCHFLKKLYAASSQSKLCSTTLSQSTTHFFPHTLYHGLLWYFCNYILLNITLTTISYAPLQYKFCLFC